MVLAGVLVFTGAPTASAHDVLPDLSMAKLIDLQQTKLSNGRPVLRYSTTIHAAAGAFEVHGARTSSSEMSQTQRIFDSTGTFRDVVTPGTMVFCGDASQPLARRQPR